MKRYKNEAFDKYRKRIKESADKLKEYLKGRLIESAQGPGRQKGRRKERDTNRRQRTTSFLRKKRAKRKTRNKMALASRRVNRRRAK